MSDQEIQRIADAGNDDVKAMAYELLRTRKEYRDRDARHANAENRRSVTLARLYRKLNHIYKVAAEELIQEPLEALK